MFTNKLFQRSKIKGDNNLSVVWNIYLSFRNSYETEGWREQVQRAMFLNLVGVEDSDPIYQVFSRCLAEEGQQKECCLSLVGFFLFYQKC